MIKHKKLLIYFFLILFIFANEGYAQVKFSKVKVSDDISMKVPKSFLVMSEEDMWQRSSSYRKALALYTDPDRMVELAVNNAFSRWEEGDIRILQNMYKASIEEIFDEVSFSQEEIKNINGRDFAVFEFVSKVKGDPQDLSKRDSIVKYYYIQYTIVAGGTLVFNFSCQNYVKDEWREAAAEVMNSVKIK